jgi:hypothetical protein
LAEIIEEFLGFVDKIDGDVAYITLTSIATGEKFFCEYSDKELTQEFREHRQFKCRTVEVGPTTVEIEFEAIPDQEITPEREQEIDEWLNRTLGDDDEPQNDY